MKQRDSSEGDSVVSDIDVETTNRKCYLFVGKWNRLDKPFELPKRVFEQFVNRDKEREIGYFMAMRTADGVVFGSVDFVGKRQRASSLRK